MATNNSTWRRRGRRSAPESRRALEAKARNHVAGLHGTAHPFRLVATAEGDQRRDAANAKSRADFRLGIGVDLRDDHPAGSAGRELFELGGDGAARTAPRRPKIHHDRRLRVADQLLEVIDAANRDGSRKWQQPRFASRAACLVEQPRRGKAILSSARAASDVHPDSLCPPNELSTGLRSELPNLRAPSGAARRQSGRSGVRTLLQCDAPRPHRARHPARPSVGRSGHGARSGFRWQTADTR